MPKRLKELRVTAISLVDKPANRKTMIWKSADKKPEPTVPTEKTIEITKRDDAKKLVYGVVYTPDEIDAQGDFARPEDIEKAAYAFMRDQSVLNVDARHDGHYRNAWIAESWLVKDSGSDPIFPGEKAGTWIVGIKIDDPTLWESVIKGELTGLSLAGTALREEETSGLVTTMKEMLTGLSTLLGARKPAETITETERGEAAQMTAQPNEEIRTMLHNLTKQIGELKERVETVEKTSPPITCKPVGAERTDEEPLTKEIVQITPLMERIRKAGEISPGMLDIGGTLRPQASRKLIDLVVAKSELLTKVYVDRTSRLRKDLDVFEVADRILTRIPEGVEPSGYTGITNIGKQFEMKDVQLFGQVYFSTLKDNLDNPNIENAIAQKWADKFSREITDLALSGIKDDNSSGFVSLNKGWPQLIKDAVTSHKVDKSAHVTAGALDWSTYLGSIVEALPEKYKSDTCALIMNKADHEAYMRHLGSLDGGVSILIQGQTKTFMGYDILAVPHLPRGTVIFTPLLNLCFGVNTDIERHRDVKATKRAIDYTYVAWLDFQVAVDDAAVIGYDLALA